MTNSQYKEDTGNMNWISFIFIILLFFYNSSFLSAQAPPVLKKWDKTYGGNSQDILMDISKGVNDGSIFLGYSSSPASGNKSSSAYSSGTVTDGWIVKLGKDGDKKWDKNYGGNNYDYFYTIEPTSDQGYIVCGSSASDPSGNKTGAKRAVLASGQDYWILKLDKNGNIQWQKVLGNTMGVGWVGGHVIECMEGGYILAGSINAAIVDGDLTKTGFGGSDFWLVKMDVNGNVEWDMVYGGDKADHLISIVQAKDSSYYLTGTSFSDTSATKKSKLIGQPSLNPLNLWLLKVTKNGDYLWDIAFGENNKKLGDNWGGGNKRYNSLVDLTDDDGCYIGGCVSYLDDSDYYLARVSSTGNVLWTNIYGGSGVEDLMSLQKTIDGGCLLAGTSENSGISGDKTMNNIGECIWIVKVDSLGNKLWDKVINGNHDDLGYAMEYSDCCYLIAGSSSAVAQNDKSEDSFGGHDYWVTYLCDTTLNSDFTFETLCIGDTVFFIPESDICQDEIIWNWNFGTIGGTSNDISPYYVYEIGDTNYTVSLTVSNWIKSKTTTQQLYIDDCIIIPTSIFIPNAFTPNDDFMNDVFYVYGVSVENFELQIFNRWGERVFSSKDILIGWDGKSGKNIAKEDIYLYRVSYDDINQQSFTLNGKVALIR